MWSRIVALSLVVLAQACTPSQPVEIRENPARVFAASSLQRLGMPGIAVAIVHRGKPAETAVAGLADVETGAAVTTATPFQLASTTKPFTATGVMRLVADGQLGLDDRIGDILEGLPDAWRPVTIAQLLSHTSGLPDITRVPGQLDLVADNWDDAFKIVREAPMQFAPGERWAYTQTNYVLLTRMIERKSGLPFERYMEERLFAPLEMHDTFFPAGDAGSRNCARNYERNTSGDPVVRDLSFPAYVHGAGGLCMSLDDFVRFNVALDAGRVLPPELAAKMWTPVLLNSGAAASPNQGSAGYGFGWALDMTPGQVSAGHSGGNSTAFRRYPEQHLSVIVLHNGVSETDALASALSRLALNPAAAAEPQAQLWDGAAAGDAKAVEAALRAGADANALDTRTSRNGRRALNWAAIGDHVDVITVLLAHGADVNGVNLTGFTALHHAAEAGAMNAAEALLAAGADRTLRTQGGAVAADIARKNDHAAVADLIAGFGTP